MQEGQRTNAGNQVHVCIGIRQAEPAALHRLAILEGHRLAAVLRRPNVDVSPLQLLPLQLARALHSLVAVNLDEPKALELACT